MYKPCTPESVINYNAYLISYGSAPTASLVSCSGDLICTDWCVCPDKSELTRFHRHLWDFFLFYLLLGRFGLPCDANGSCGSESFTCYVATDDPQDSYNNYCFRMFFVFLRVLTSLLFMIHFRLKLRTVNFAYTNSTVIATNA